MLEYKESNLLGILNKGRCQLIGQVEPNAIIHTINLAYV
jgi:hypothetical protein